MHPLLLIALLAAASAKPYEAVLDADEKAVQSCTYVGDVEGTSGWGGLAGSYGVKRARIAAKKRAVKLGATHVVWTTVVGGYAPSASGRAYRCET